MKVIPAIAEFREPLIESQSTDIAQALDQRLALLCSEFGIGSEDKYRALSLKLLADVIGAKGFQVLDKAQKRGGGAPVVWTFRRHVALVRYVKKRINTGDTPQRAIGRARNIFARALSKPDLTDQVVRAEYFRAKRFVDAAPRVAAAMVHIDPVPESGAGQALARFVEHGATIYTAYGPQLIARTHLVQAKRKPAHGRTRTMQDSG
ncbi:hypothetical protein [uncultured Bradyrhizobium sp.]|uniref:hypothetical protein n=1 Tax=uncultured Bradyrhizobium sp. TaxID=199684 RepID=UPI002607F40A|nr:hypothetical protein [uncultured Bradyrhizobium sp.]